jgi:hypothetical protein
MFASVRSNFQSTSIVPKSPQILCRPKHILQKCGIVPAYAPSCESHQAGLIVTARAPRPCDILHVRPRVSISPCFRGIGHCLDVCGTWALPSFFVCGSFAEAIHSANSNQGKCRCHPHQKQLKILGKINCQPQYVWLDWGHVLI